MRIVLLVVLLGLLRGDGLRHRRQDAGNRLASEVDRHHGEHGLELRSFSKRGEQHVQPEQNDFDEREHLHVIREHGGDLLGYIISLKYIKVNKTLCFDGILKTLAQRGFLD